MDVNTKLHPAIAAMIVIVLIGISTAVVAALDGEKKMESTIQDKMPTSSTSKGSLDSQSANNGTHTATGEYRTPGGTESISLTVTLKDNIIEDIDLEQHASGGDTAIYQAKFASGYKPLVKGKNINEVKLTRVAGSSLTSSGFNQALESIKRDIAS